VTVTVNPPGLEVFNLSVASGRPYQVVGEGLVSGSPVFKYAPITWFTMAGI
jgi:hypothetical protein